jgi:hypothetical protein
MTVGVLPQAAPPVNQTSPSPTHQMSKVSQIQSDNMAEICESYLFSLKQD